MTYDNVRHLPSTLPSTPPSTSPGITPSNNTSVSTSCYSPFVRAAAAMDLQYQKPFYPYGTYRPNPCITGNCTSTVTAVVVHLTTPIEIRFKYIVFSLYIFWHILIICYYYFAVHWVKPRKGRILPKVTRKTKRVAKKTYSGAKEWSKKKIQKDLYVAPNQFEKPDPGAPVVQLRWREAVDPSHLGHFPGLRRRKVLRQNKFDWFE
ncbi:hypothetical protein TWF718_009330 [Orbilia javanica]|uniref:Uncharacterized protein n=1 Tax=Orbilia javanica TaxID=47235 RepID=A0AAN8N2S9_9PEZI